PAMRRDDPSRDAQSQAAAVHRVAVAGIASEKWLENAPQIFGRDTRAGVCYLDFGGIAQPAKLDRDSPSALVVLDGIVREVQQQLAQTMAITFHCDFIARRDADLDFLRPSQTLGVRAGCL